MKKNNNNKQKGDSSVKVIVRVRPTLSIEAGTENVVSIGPDDQSVTIKTDEYNQIQTKFDLALGGEKNQKEVFQSVAPKIRQLVDGYNLTIFAYGQTGSGKTFTMFGKDWENSFQEMRRLSKKSKQSTPLTDVDSDDHYAGLIPRTAHHLFSYLSQVPGKFNVFCSFIQIYNEKIFDLLQDSPKPNPLNIHESKFEGIFVEGLGQFQVDQYMDCLELMSRGEKNRFIRQTSMNAKSSRSHTIFQIMLQSATINEKGQYTRARLNLCDLAGSEKINKRENMVEEHLQELKNINLSLTTLGKVINSLSKGSQVKNTSFFRQSKLTRLLQESLVGNTNTIIIGAISPSSKCQQQTLNTLKFVERARHIKLTIKPTTISNSGNQVVQKLQQEMEQLRRLLQEKQKIKVPKEIQQKLSHLEHQNELLKNDASNKKYTLQQMMEQNRRMKEALVRMERVALEDFSEDLSVSEYSDQSQLQKKKNAKPNKKEIFAQIKKTTLPALQDRSPRAKEAALESPHLGKNSKKVPQQSSRKYDRGAQKSLPAVGNKAKDQTIDKRRMISRLQNIEQIQRTKELQLLKDLDQIEEQDREKSERLNRSMEASVYRNSKGGSLTLKARRKIDYAERIRELESRLRK